MSYEHCERHDADATNGCEQCLAERQEACPHNVVSCCEANCQKRIERGEHEKTAPQDEAVVWADEASPFTGPQVKALLDENERLHSDKKTDPVINSLRAQHELRKFERRERIAAMCLQGLLADTEFLCAPREAATKAANYADALIKELGEPFL